MNDLSCPSTVYFFYFVRYVRWFPFFGGGVGGEGGGAEGWVGLDCLFINFFVRRGWWGCEVGL